MPEIRGSVSFMKILYAKYNRGRLPEFQLETTVYQDEGKKWVRKKPLNSNGTSHIKSIYENTLILSKTFKNISVVMPKYAEGSLIYPFIHGHSWDTLMLTPLLNGDKVGFLSLLNRFSQLLYGLQVNDKENFVGDDSFKEVFGVRLELEQAAYLQPANIDLTFDNILIANNDKQMLIDCEWVFPFKVPILFILFRSIYSFWVKHQENIRPLYQLEELLGEVGITQELMETFIEMEEVYFQAYVHGQKNVGASLKQYIQKNYSLDYVNSLLSSEHFTLKVFYYDQNKTYLEDTFIYTNTSKEFVEYKIPLKYSISCDHIRIDPIDIPSFVQINEIELFRLNEDNLVVESIVKCCQASGYSELTYGDNIIPIDSSEHFSFFALDKNNHLFLQVGSRALSQKNLHLRIVMHVNTRYSSDFKKLVNKKVEKLELHERLIEQKNLRLNELEKIIKEKETEIRTKEQKISEQQKIIDIMSSSYSWKATKPFRDMKSLLKDKR